MIGRDQPEAASERCALVRGEERSSTAEIGGVDHAMPKSLGEQHERWADNRESVDDDRDRGDPLPDPRVMSKDPVLGFAFLKVKVELPATLVLLFRPYAI